MAGGAIASPATPFAAAAVPTCTGLTTSAFLVRLIDLLGRVFAVAAGAGAVLTTTMISLDVLLRVFGSSLPGTYEITITTSCRSCGPNGLTR